MAAALGSLDRPPADATQVLQTDTGSSNHDSNMPSVNSVSVHDVPPGDGPSHDGEVKDTEAAAGLATAAEHGDGPPPEPSVDDGSAAIYQLMDADNLAHASAALEPSQTATEGLPDCETEAAASDSISLSLCKPGSGAVAASAAPLPSGNLSDAGDSTSDNSLRRMPRMITSVLAADGGEPGGSASPGCGSSGGGGHSARTAADLAKAKEREEQVRLRRELINREKQKKIDELLEAQRLAQEYRRRQEELRRQKIEDMKRKEEERQKLAEDRRQARDREDEERRSQLQQRKLERRHRLEEELAATRRRGSSGRRSEAFGFGSSSPRFDDSLAAAAIAAGKRSSSISNVYSAGHRAQSSSGGDSSDGGGGDLNGSVVVTPSGHPAAASSTSPRTAAAVTAAAVASSTPLSARQLSKSTSNLVAGGGSGSRGTRGRRPAVGMAAAASMLAVTPEVSRSDSDTGDSASLLSGRRSRGDTLTATPRSRTGGRRPPDSPSSDGPPSSLRPASGESAAVRLSRSVERRRRPAVAASASAASRGRVPATSRAKSAPARGVRPAASDNQSSPRGGAATSSSSSDAKSPRVKPRPAWVGGPADDGAAADEPVPVPSGNVVRVLRSPPPDVHRTIGDTPKVTISEKTLERLAMPKVVKVAEPAATPAAGTSSKAGGSGIAQQTLERLATPKHSRAADGDGGEDAASAAKDAKPAGHAISSKTLERLATPKHSADDEAEGGGPARPTTAAAAGGATISLKTLERLSAPKRSPAAADGSDETKKAGAGAPAATPAAPERPPRKKTRAAAASPKHTDKPATPASPEANEEVHDGDDQAAATTDAEKQEEGAAPNDTSVARAATDVDADGSESKPAGSADEGSQLPQAAAGDTAVASSAAAAVAVAVATASGSSESAAAKRQSRPIKRGTPSSAAAPRPHVTVSELPTTADKRGDGKNGETMDKHAPRRRPLSAKRAPKTAAQDGDNTESPEEPKAKTVPRMLVHTGMRKAKSVASVATKLSPDHHAKADVTREPEAAAAVKTTASRAVAVASVTTAPNKSKFPKSKSHDVLKAAAGSSTPVRLAGPFASGRDPTKDELSTGAEDGTAESAAAAAVVVVEKPEAEAQDEAPPSAAAQDEATAGGSTGSDTRTPPEERTSASEKRQPLAESSAEAAGTADSAKVPMDAYKMKLAEKRRQAREKADKEAEEERRRQEEQRLAEEEAERRQAEEERRQQDEERRLVEEAARAEEERLRLAIEETEKRRREQAEAAEAERLAKEEADRKAKEEAEKRERVLREKIEREEAERLERKKKLESIMKRVKTEPSSQEMKKNDSYSSLISMTDSFTLGSVGGKSSPTTVTTGTTISAAAALGKDSEDASKFRSPLLNSLIAGRSKSDAAMKTTSSPDDGGGSSSTGGDVKSETHSRTGSTNGLNGAYHDGEAKVTAGNGGQSEGTAGILTGREQFAKTGTAVASSPFGSLFGNNNVIDARQSPSSDVGGLESLQLVSAGSGNSSSSPVPALEPIEGAH